MLDSAETPAAWIALQERGGPLNGISTIASRETLPEGPILQALDARGRRHYLLPLPSESKLNDNASAGVKLLGFQLEGKPFLDIRCDIPRLNGVFDDLADDLIAAARQEPEHIPEACKEALDSWRTLLRSVRNSNVAETAVVGVLAELMIVVEIVSRGGPNRIDVWTGAEHRRHDIRNGNAALEVKCSKANTSRRIQIHGLTQLEPPENGSLHLVFVRLEAVTGGEISVPRLVSRLRDLGVAPQTVLETLDSRGIAPGTADHLEFSHRETMVYEVGEGFPALTTSNFPMSEIPPGLDSVKYEIDLDRVTTEPLDDTAMDQLLQRLASHESA